MNEKPEQLENGIYKDKPPVRSKSLPRARMNSTVHLLAWSILFVGLSGFVLLFVISGSLNGWWGGEPWGVQ